MSIQETRKTMSMLPGDEVRQIMWRYSDRYDVQMAVMGARSVARGLVARLVADGERNTHEWTAAKNTMYQAFDDSGITAAGLDTSYGGIIDGPRNFALALIAYELSWVDGGASTTSLVNNLALAPIVEKGTPEQKERYMTLCCPPQPGEDRKTWRGAFALTEPLPYVGVDTGVLSGKVRVAEWKEGEEPMLQVEKRGRFITNMEAANFVTAAVDTGDERIKSSCMIILEEGDEGIFDRGSPTLKMVHQLSNTCDPIFNLKVPASRIVGGYTIQDGQIVPNLNHSEIIEAVFSRTRVTVGVMTAAKLLSAVEPVIRYHRTRFRGAVGIEEGSPRYDLGLQMKEDALHRLADLWATGEAASSLGFETTRLYDDITPIEDQANAQLAEAGINGGRAKMKALREPQERAIECIQLMMLPEGERDESRVQELYDDVMVRYVWLDAITNVLCPACKLWDTGHGANMLREAVSMMGGYGITEDCPGFLFQKWNDAQLEATYEGPEVVQRRHISVTMNNPVFLAQVDLWIHNLTKLAAEQPESGAAALAAGFEMWKWAQKYLSTAADASGARLYRNQRQGVLFPLTDAIAWLVAARSLIADVQELAQQGADHPVVGTDIKGYVNTFNDLCNIQSARAAGEVGRICAELFYGYVDNAEQTGGAAAEFQACRAKLDASLAGSKLAKDRAGKALATIMIPEALDYPA
ncbi:MAG: acyl-CoA/acyl-ACP dehydrogenase [Kiritimatiellae bacterium]|nr:acyl-CoA/acyl-ACP dehydrogenase [Kiritimatiellia bacterium]